MKKSNKQYIYFALGVVAVLVIGFFVASLFNQEFQIKTKKNKYSQGEEVSFVIKNSDDGTLSYDIPLYVLEYHDGNDWSSVDDNDECIEERFVPGIEYFDPEEKIIWDQNKMLCKNGKLVFEQVSPGTYRIKVNFFETGEMVSNEFEIE